MMVAIPETRRRHRPDGVRRRGTAPTAAPAARAAAPGSAPSREMRPAPSAPTMLAARVARLVALRRAPARGAQASASCCSTSRRMPARPAPPPTSRVFESLHNTLHALKREGYDVDVARDRRRAARRGARRQCRALRRSRPTSTPASPPTTIVRREPHLAEIEAQWGPAPGRQQSDGRGDLRARRAVRQRLRRRPARLRLRGRPDAAAVRARLRADPRLHRLLPLAARGFRRRRACCTSARTARSNSCPASRPACPATCWPDRLIGDLPNIYLYAANNPSEGTIAKRRSGATLVSYLTPPVAAGRALPGPARPEGLARPLARRAADERPPSGAELAALIRGAGRGASTSPAEPTSDRALSAQRCCETRARR